MGRHDQEAAGAPHRLAGQGLDARAAGARRRIPNARFTVASTQCPSLDPHWDDPDGVPIAAFVFGARRSRHRAARRRSARRGRRASTRRRRWARKRPPRPPATVGEVRRDPFAMLPFCGYHVGDYFAHWLRDGQGGRAAAADLQRQLVPQGRRTASSSGRASARTCACCSGSSSAAAGAAHARRNARWASSPPTATSTGRGIDFAPDRFAAGDARRSRAMWTRELAAHDAALRQARRQAPGGAGCREDPFGREAQRLGRRLANLAVCERPHTYAN